MKGTIFILFEDFVAAELGDDALDDVLAAAGLAGAEPFVGPGTYPAHHLSALVAATSERTGRPADDVLRTFGRFAFPALARSAATLLDGVTGPRQLLEQLDSIVDTEVRKLDPDAHPARFIVMAVAGDELLLEYESSHGLFPLVSGVLDGIGDWFGTAIDHRLVSTQGTNGTYLITFPTSPSRPPSRRCRPASELRPVTDTAAAHELADRVARLEARLRRERERNRILTDMIEDRTRAIYLAQAEMRDNKAHLESILRSLFSALFITDFDGIVTSVGGATQTLTGLAGDEIVGRPVWDFLLFPPLDGTSTGRHEARKPPTAGPTAPDVERLCLSQHEAELVKVGAGTVPVLVNVSKLRNERRKQVGVVFLAMDTSERRQLELELRQAQRLEAIGQLAAGVAHEINTPIQFVGDSARFLGDVFDDLIGLLGCYGELKKQAEAAGLADATAAVDARIEGIDLDFLVDEAPRAVERTLEGVNRIATIVKALKQFSHPGGEHMAPTDINELIETTLVVARNEYKYVADVRTELGPVPEVTCHRGDIASVLLNLVVNAAHALTDRFGGTDQRGEISIRSRLDDEGVGVIVEVADTGGGIPATIRDRVFEPFFTTKEVGKGTGQGLAIAHNVVVAKHRGRITFDVDDAVPADDPRAGTTFRVWLPVDGWQ
ncbi:MAG: heme NO-binding domain-containing protein [Acidimicrobiales bacterium]